MAGNTWFCADHHFGHQNIIWFVDSIGQRTRPFVSLEEMTETIVSRHNAVVGQHDRVYFLGDVAIAKRGLLELNRLRGKKVLIRGNHDIFKLHDYTPYFEDIRAYKVYPKHGVICSHVPLHPRQFSGNFKLNVHGHTHHNNLDDSRYLNVSLEQTDYLPVNLEFILKKVKESEDDNYDFTVPGL